MARVMVVAPHPDDETIACGGTLQRHRSKGDEIYWIIVTEMRIDLGFTEEQMNIRQDQIREVSEFYGFVQTVELGFPTTELDKVPRNDLVEGFKRSFAAIKPEVVYLPHPSDIHSDHTITFKAASANCKWFRATSLQQVFAYETVSETDFHIDPSLKPFKPNFYVDISNFVNRKLSCLEIYGDEIGEFPFPRSSQTVSALAQKRGSECGCLAAEAFMLLWNVER